MIPCLFVCLSIYLFFVIWFWFGGSFLGGFFFFFFFFCIAGRILSFFPVVFGLVYIWVGDGMSGRDCPYYDIGIFVFMYSYVR